MRISFTWGLPDCTSRYFWLIFAKICLIQTQKCSSNWNFLNRCVAYCRKAVQNGKVRICSIPKNPAQLPLLDRWRLPRPRERTHLPQWPSKHKGERTKTYLQSYGNVHDRYFWQHETAWTLWVTALPWSESLWLDLWTARQTGPRPKWVVILNQRLQFIWKLLFLNLYIVVSFLITHLFWQ